MHHSISTGLTHIQVVQLFSGKSFHNHFVFICKMDNIKGLKTDIKVRKYLLVILFILKLKRNCSLKKEINKFKIFFLQRNTTWNLVSFDSGKLCTTFSCLYWVGATIGNNIKCLEKLTCWHNWTDPNLQGCCFWTKPNDLQCLAFLDILPFSFHPCKSTLVLLPSLVFLSLWFLQKSMQIS